jgi:hypothetical protein
LLLSSAIIDGIVAGNEIHRTFIALRHPGYILAA